MKARKGIRFFQLARGDEVGFRQYKLAADGYGDRLISLSSRLLVIY